MDNGLKDWQLNSVYMNVFQAQIHKTIINLNKEGDNYSVPVPESRQRKSRPFTKGGSNRMNELKIEFMIHGWSLCNDDLRRCNGNQFITIPMIDLWIRKYCTMSPKYLICLNCVDVSDSLSFPCPNGFGDLRLIVWLVQTRIGHLALYLADLSSKKAYIANSSAGGYRHIDYVIGQKITSYIDRSPEMKEQLHLQLLECPQQQRNDCAVFCCHFGREYLSGGFNTAEPLFTLPDVMRIRGQMKELVTTYLGRQRILRRQRQ